MEPKKQEYKTQGNIGLFDDEQTLEKLNDMGNPLDRLSGVIDFEMFRDILEKALHKDKMTKAGAKPYDPVLMFKILVLQRMYHFSDEQTEYQIRDRLSFRDFLGLASGDRIPDRNTVWLFREELVRKNVFEQLFQKFYAFLEANNLIMKEGVIVDGSFVNEQYGINGSLNEGQTAFAPNNISYADGTNVNEQYGIGGSPAQRVVITDVGS